MTTWAALLTSPARSALATVALWGARAVEIADERFRSIGGRKLAEARVGDVRYGRWRTAAAADCHEDVVVGRVAPDEVHIHGHGGDAAPAALLASLAQSGAAVVSAADWIAAHEPRPLARAALALFPRAATQHTAELLLDQYDGALERALAEIAGLLGRGQCAAALHDLQALLAQADYGLHLATPFRVVLAGAPNVGKSTLLNALLGSARAIVAPLPGTTRDVVASATALDGWPLELHDTAGLRNTDDPLEAAGISLARRATQAADLVLHVLDATQPPTAADELPAAEAARVLCVWNKCDLSSARAPPPGSVAVSALTGAGLAELCGRIVARLAPAPPPRGTALPFLPEHVAALQSAIRHLESGAVAAARAALPGYGGTDLRGNPVSAPRE